MDEVDIKFLDLKDLNDMVIEAINEGALKPDDEHKVSGYRRGLKGRYTKRKIIIYLIN